mmetsp:Transcript_502/g.1722  ORF Transcript_502/g.1722 Transcript_502/m.1722 type:complete len:270 (-) Transcript_502:758-1567(-)
MCSAPSRFLLLLTTVKSIISKGASYPGRTRRSISSTLASAPSNVYPLFSRSLILSNTNLDLPFHASSEVPGFKSPNSLAFVMMLPRPESSETSTLLRFPTASGLMCWYVFSFFRTAATCRPPLCANAEEPTNGLELSCGLLACSSTNLLSSVRRDKLSPGTHRMPIFSCNVGIMLIRFALPVLSPYPFAVPWMTVAPALAEAREFATASSMSLCACMPTRHFTLLQTSLTISSTCHGLDPPFVSQRTTTSTPALSAARTLCIAYSLFAR